MRIRLLILTVGLVAAGLYLGMAWGGGSSSSAVDLQDLPTGALGRDEAIQAARMVATVEKFDIENTSANEQTLAEYATDRETSLGSAMVPGRDVWVITFTGAGVNKWGSVDSNHSVFDVVFDKNTGDVVAVTYRD